PFEFELDWTSTLGPKSISPLLGIEQSPIPTLTLVGGLGDGYTW
ncbi:14225_t:CDS:2, partial [Funneliformis caledonium]